MAQAAEEERQRRIDENQSNDDGKGIPILMRVVQRQRLNFQSVLGDEVSKYGQYCQLVFKKRKKAYEDSIEKVRAVVQARFQGAGVEPYGSYASGIMTPDSDIDLVVCMAGDTSWRSNSEEWMINLAKDLKACGWVSNLKAIVLRPVPTSLESWTSGSGPWGQARWLMDQGPWAGALGTSPY